MFSLRENISDSVFVGLNRTNKVAARCKTFKKISIKTGYSRYRVLMIGKRELVALLNSSSWCLVMVDWLFLAVPWGCLQFVIVVFPDHTHLLFLSNN